MKPNHACTRLASRCESQSWFRVVVAGVVEAGASASTGGSAWELARTGQLHNLGVCKVLDHGLGQFSGRNCWSLARAPTYVISRTTFQDLLGDGAEELVAGDRLTSERSQDPGVEVDVCLAASSSFGLS